MKSRVHFFQESNVKKILKDVAIGAVASILLGVCAPFTMHLPYTPVPVTLQVQLALFLSALMGPYRAVSMIVAFLIQGVLNFPVFAGGATSIATLIGPRGGYLIGYLIAAFVASSIYQGMKNKSKWVLFFAMTIGNLIVYASGMSWLSMFCGIKNAWLLGVYPFILADGVKLSLFALLGRGLKK